MVSCLRAGDPSCRLALLIFLLKKQMGKLSLCACHKCLHSYLLVVLDICYPNFELTFVQKNTYHSVIFKLLQITLNNFYEVAVTPLRFCANSGSVAILMVDCIFRYRTFMLSRTKAILKLVLILFLTRLNSSK